MWLLDANIPVQLLNLLRSLGVEADSAIVRGWNTLSNGNLVQTAVDAKFSALLTRDGLFGQSAAKVLRRYPDFGVVHVTLTQARAPQFLSAFRSAWQNAPIVPAKGQLIQWPAPEV
jgi:hypothetical protein